MQRVSLQTVISMQRDLRYHLGNSGYHLKSFIIVYVHEKNKHCEPLAAFYKVGQVIAIDEDHPPNCLTYKIISGDIQAVRRFWIHPFSGVIELTSQPDYESVRQYNLTVQAVDCDRAHPRTAVATVSKETQVLCLYD